MIAATKMEYGEALYLSFSSMIKIQDDEKNYYRQTWAGHMNPMQLHPP